MKQSESKVSRKKPARKKATKKKATKRTARKKATKKKATKRTTKKKATKKRTTKKRAAKKRAAKKRTTKKRAAKKKPVEKSDNLLDALGDSDSSLLELLGGAPPANGIKKKKGSFDHVDRLNAIDKLQSKQRRDSQNIGWPPDRIDWGRRKPSDMSLRVFLETYFPGVFCLEWSEDHIRLIDKIERAVLKGELSALAMPRGSGKTSLIIRAAIWAIVTGRRRYVAIIAATETKAQRLLKSIKTEILHNDELKQDYSAELHCLISLGNRAALSGGQHIDGELTGVEWNVGHINFGFVNLDRCEKTNNAVIVAMGITGDIRGEQATTPDGTIRRPDLVLVDDPQTKKSAGSKSQVQKRHETLMGDVLGMSGPGHSIAGMAAMTVIYASDLADRLLDPEQSPEWQGERCKMIYEWPTDMQLWDEYQTIYEEELRAERGHDQSTQHVIDNYDAMHFGSHVGWEARFDRKKEISALHHAFNLRIRDEAAFAAEYQNEPLEGFAERPFDLIADQLARRTLSNHLRNECPAEADTITAAIDVQKNLLYYMVCAWSPSSRCFIMDYGSYPDQRRTYFSKREIPISLQDAAQTDEFEDALLDGLNELTDTLLTKEYDTGNGTSLMIDRLVIDARWGDSTEAIRQFCRESEHKSRINPSMGLYIGANSRKWQKIKINKRDKKGIHCKLTPPATGTRGRPELLIDVNFWKTFVASRLTVNATSNRAMVLYDASPTDHRLISEHLSAEMPKKVQGKTGEVVTEWDQPKGVDNDWWDCLVYNSAIASVLGVKTHDTKKLKKDAARQARSNRATVKPKTGGKESARDRMEKRRKRRG